MTTDSKQPQPQGHRIRLRGPWHKQWQDTEEAIRIKVPELESPLSSGAVIYHRTFNRPTGLVTASKVYLEIEKWRGELVEIQLNESSISPALPTDLTAHLKNHNKLSIHLKPNASQPQLSGDVHLVITQAPPQDFDH